MHFCIIANTDLMLANAKQKHKKNYKVKQILQGINSIHIIDDAILQLKTWQFTVTWNISRKKLSRWLEIEKKN